MNTDSPNWMRLDNAAKIYPAVRKRSWSAMFRLSATLNETIEPRVLQTALAATLKRFPSLAVRLRRGFFWYYLEGIQSVPAVIQDESYPCKRMTKDEIRRCAFRVLYYNNRIAVEFFHALTDGSGGMVFLKTLLAEYLSLKHHTEIPSIEGVLDRNMEPNPGELEDSFFVHEGDIKQSRREEKSYRLKGTLEPDRFLHLTAGTVCLSDILPVAKRHSVSLTVLLVSIMIAAVIDIQNKDISHRRRQKPVKIQVPVNLRQFFKSETLRNFALYITPGVDPRMGDYSFAEILKAVHHKMGGELNDKNLKAKLTANVRSEKNLLLKIMPLFIKNVALRTVYNIIGETTSSVTLSNMGIIKLPPEMSAYVKRMDFILGALAKNPYNCGVLSYGDKLYINIIRTVREPVLEHGFFTYLRKLGIPVKIESNRR
ncbi:MAG: hypothetical protein GX111_13130 [Clostridiales bacterium]|nr:hypothetical protein [Clostridiales bacterium]